MTQSQERTNRMYNMQLYSEGISYESDFWEFPIIKRESYIPSDLISFNEILKVKPIQDCGIHFFNHDYQFERIWTYPDRYLEIVKRWGCMLSPDFSTYLDMMPPQQFYNCYRSRLIGAYYQAQGVKVIPTLQWSSPRSLDYCFKGLQDRGTYAGSTVGISRDKWGRELCICGLTEAVKRLNPETLIVYGKEIDFDFQNTKVVFIKNKNSSWGKNKNEG